MSAPIHFDQNCWCGVAVHPRPPQGHALGADRILAIYRDPRPYRANVMTYKHGKPLVPETVEEAQLRVLRRKASLIDGVLSEDGTRFTFDPTELFQ